MTLRPRGRVGVLCKGSGMQLKDFKQGYGLIHLKSKDPSSCYVGN